MYVITLLTLCGRRRFLTPTLYLFAYVMIALIVAALIVAWP
jgi:hypothetical protein